MIEKLEKAVDRPVWLEGGGVSMRASIGAAVYPLEARDPAGLQEVADAAMYRRKRCESPPIIR